MRVAVLGAGGTIAPAIVRDLAESDEVQEMVLLDLDAERATAVADAHGGGKAVATRVDATAGAGEQGSLPDSLGDCEVLLNAASYRVNLDAMRACLEAGCHYIDLGGLYHLTGRQLELNGEFEAAGLSALLGMGSAPGKTNLMAKMAADHLTGDRAASGGGAEEAARLDSIHVAAAGRDLDPPDGFSVPYALRTLIDEITLRPIILRGGEPVEIDPLDDGGTVEYGDPVGVGETVFTLHSEMRTFGESFGCREGSFRLSLAASLLERLRELAEASDEEINEAARAVEPPSPNTVSVHVIDAVKGERAVRVRAVTRPMEAWGLGGGIVSTAAPAAAAVRLFGRGSIERRGVFPPEAAIDPEEMFTELKNRGVSFEIQDKEGVRA